MILPPASPDLNSMDNLFTIVKKKIYVGDNQCANN